MEVEPWNLWSQRLSCFDSMYRRHYTSHYQLLRYTHHLRNILLIREILHLLESLEGCRIQCTHICIWVDEKSSAHNMHMLNIKAFVLVRSGLLAYVFYGFCHFAWRYVEFNLTHGLFETWQQMKYLLMVAIGLEGLGGLLFTFDSSLGAYLLVCSSPLPLLHFEAIGLSLVQGPSTNQYSRTCCW